MKWAQSWFWMLAPSFVPIVRENWQAVVRLAIFPEQEKFLWSNASSLVECLYETDAAMQAYAISVDEQTIGLLVFGTDTEDASSCFIYQLMIDAKQQGKGYGAKAMQWLVERCKGQYHTMRLSYEPNNQVASQFYAKFGFRKRELMLSGAR
jgi:diamine N-acetyltransferase